MVIGHETYYQIETKYGGIYYQNLMDVSKVNDSYFHIITGYVTTFIYTFHMPLFIALSGFLFEMQLKKGKYKELKKLVVNKFRRLLIPYFIVWMLWNLPIKYISGYYNEKSFSDIMMQILFPDSVYLWFLISLFCAFIIVFLLKKQINSKKIVLALCILLYFFQLLLDRITSNNVIFSKPFSSCLWF